MKIITSSGMLIVIINNAIANKTKTFTIINTMEGTFRFYFNGDKELKYGIDACFKESVISKDCVFNRDQWSAIKRFIKNIEDQPIIFEIWDPYGNGSIIEFEVSHISKRF